MLNNITNFFNLIATRKIKTTTNTSDLLPLGTRDSRYTGCYQPTAILACDLINQVISCVPSIVVLGTGCCSTLRCGSTNTASGNFSTVFGRCNTASNIYSTVSGGIRNTASGGAATIGGGLQNTASCNFTTIGGGKNNTASNIYSTISGGLQNTASNYHSTVSGGYNNTASGYDSGILAGRSNTASCACSFIVGSNITSDRCCTTFVNNLSIKDIPTSSAGLPTKSVWFDSATCTLKMVP